MLRCTAALRKPHGHKRGGAGTKYFTGSESNVKTAPQSEAGVRYDPPPRHMPERVNSCTHKHL